MDEYLVGLMDELSKSIGPDEGSPKLTLDAEPLSVTTDQAVSIGVIVTEALRYLENRLGRWRRSDAVL